MGCRACADNGAVVSQASFGTIGPWRESGREAGRFLHRTWIVRFLLASVVVLVVIATGLWGGPPKAEYPYSGKTWATKEEERAAIRDYRRYKTFDDIWSSALVGALAPLGIGLALYVVLTEKDNPCKGASAKIKLAYGLVAVVSLIQIVVAPMLILINTWRYLSL